MFIFAGAVKIRNKQDRPAVFFVSYIIIAQKMPLVNMKAEIC